MSTPHVTRAKNYAKRVVTGKKLSGPWEILACERFISDLKRDDLEFKNDKAEDACQFIEKFSHVKGRWARDSQRLKLESWQCFIVCSMFGFFKGGVRRFTEVYVRVSRKNGKSILGASIGLYMFVADGEYGAEIYSGATSEKQAWEVFGPARLMAKQHKVFAGHFGVEIGAKNMSRAEDNSKFEPIIGNPGDGPSPSLAIIDEFHEHKRWDLYNAMDTGQGAREQPLKLILTTAGDDIASPCFEKDEDCKKILDGTFVDDSIFAIIYSSDPSKDNWTSVAAMKKANPNLGVSVSRAYLDRQLAKAKRTPSSQAAYKTKNLDLWVGSSAAYLNTLKWEECADSSLKIEDFIGYPCIFGVDLASRIDVVAVIRLFYQPAVDEENLRYWCFPRFFLPENRIDEDKTGQYKRWVDLKALETHDDDEIDFAQLRKTIKEDAEIYSPAEIAYDPWRAMGLEQELSAEGFTMVKIPQTTKHFTSPMDELEAAHLSRRIVHNDNPVMNWMAGNLVAKRSGTKNKVPHKDRERNKIDGPVALLMAMNRAMSEDNKVSIYEQRGLRKL